MRVGVRGTLWVSAKYMIRKGLLCQCVKLRKIADASDNTVDLGPDSVDLSLLQLRLSFLYKPRLCAYHEASHSRSPVLALALNQRPTVSRHPVAVAEPDARSNLR